MDIANLIKQNRLEEADKYVKNEIANGRTVLNSHRFWSLAYNNENSNDEKIILVNNNLSEEFYECLRIDMLSYASLSNKHTIGWNKNKSDNYRDFIRSIISKISQTLNNDPSNDYWLDPGLLFHLQLLINRLDNNELLTEKLEFSKIKAEISKRLSETGYIKKSYYGSDLLQFAETNISVDNKEDAVKIFEEIKTSFLGSENSDFKNIFPEIKFINTDEQELNKYVVEKAIFELNKINGVHTKEPVPMKLDEERYEYEKEKRELNDPEYLKKEEDRLREKKLRIMNRKRVPIKKENIIQKILKLFK